MEYIGDLSDQGLVKGIKLQLLHILEGTDLGLLYLNDSQPNNMSITKEDLNLLSMEEYIQLVITCLEHLPMELIIHRLTGDGPKKILLAPTWSSNKKLVLNALHRNMKITDSWQGKHYK